MKLKLLLILMLIGTDQVMCAYTKKETVAIDGI